jgi:hypothetical protein
MKWWDVHTSFLIPVGVNNHSLLPLSVKRKFYHYLVLGFLRQTPLAITESKQVDSSILLLQSFPKLKSSLLLIPLLLL